MEMWSEHRARSQVELRYRRSYCRENWPGRSIRIADTARFPGVHRVGGEIVEQLLVREHVQSVIHGRRQLESCHQGGVNGLINGQNREWREEEECRGEDAGTH